MGFPSEARRVDSLERFVRLRAKHPEPAFDAPLDDDDVDALDKLTEFDIQTSKSEARVPSWSMAILERSLLTEKYWNGPKLVRRSLTTLAKTWLRVSEREFTADARLWWKTMENFFPLLAVASKKNASLADRITATLSGDIVSVLVRVSSDRAHYLWECFNDCIQFSSDSAKMEAFTENKQKVRMIGVLLTECEEFLTQITLLKNLFLWLTDDNKQEQIKIVFPEQYCSSFRKAFLSLNVTNFLEDSHRVIYTLNKYNSTIITLFCVKAYWNGIELNGIGNKIWIHFSVKKETLSICTTGTGSLDNKWGVIKMYFRDVKKTSFLKNKDLSVLNLQTSIRMSESLAFAYYDIFQGKLDLYFTEKSFKYLCDSRISKFIFHNNLNKCSDGKRKISRAVLTVMPKDTHIKKRKISKAILTIRRKDRLIKKSYPKVPLKIKVSTVKMKVNNKEEPETSPISLYGGNEHEKDKAIKTKTKNAGPIHIISSVNKNNDHTIVADENKSNIPSVLNKNDKVDSPEDTSHHRQNITEHECIKNVLDSNRVLEGCSKTVKNKESREKLERFTYKNKKKSKLKTKFKKPLKNTNDCIHSNTLCNMLPTPSHPVETVSEIYNFEENALNEDRDVDAESSISFPSLIIENKISTDNRINCTSPIIQISPRNIFCDFSTTDKLILLKNLNINNNYKNNLVEIDPFVRCDSYEKEIDKSENEELSSTEEENDLNTPPAYENLKRYMNRYYMEIIKGSEKRLKRLGKLTTISDKSHIQPYINDLFQFAFRNYQEVVSTNFKKNTSPKPKSNAVKKKKRNKFYLF